MTNMDVSHILLFVILTTSFFVVSLLLGCFCWYMWGGYRDIPDPVIENESIDSNVSEISQLEIKDRNKDK